MKKNLHHKGFTLIEVLLTMSLIGIITSISYFGVSSFNSSTYDAAFIDRLYSDIKTQQLKAMQLTKGSLGVKSYGVYFQKNSYTLFTGDVFNSNDLDNYNVTVDSGAVINEVALPDNSIIFEPLTGEIKNFSQNQNYIDVSEKFRIVFSRLGTVTITMTSNE